MAFLEVARVCKSYGTHAGRRPALHDVSLEVEPGEFAVVLGPSGCGKTTLLRLISGLDPHYEGSIRVAPGRLGFVFQEPRLLPWLSAAGNVRFALDPAPPAGGADAETWLRRVGLAAHAGAYPHQLSIGMQQRVALARAFAVRPRLLLMYEPMSALDEVTAGAVAGHLVELWQSERPTVLMVTHRVEEAVSLADRIWVLTAAPGRVWTSVRVPLARPRARGPALWETVEAVRAQIQDAAGASWTSGP